MGHKSLSTVAVTDYQAPDRAIDLTSACHENMTSDSSIIDLHSSVAWNAGPSRSMLPTTIQNRITGDKELQQLIQQFATADLELKKTTGMFFDEALKECHSFDIHLIFVTYRLDLPK